jgi:ATP-dependent Lon protease
VGQEAQGQADLALAEKVLDADHHGLEKVKERIVEYLAVQARSAKLKGPILCLVGPPGVGKTSLGKSVAKATGREFVRMASAACATKPRSAATAAPISARCPARSFSR